MMVNKNNVKQTGITIIYNIEWQEKTLLRQGEWIKFMGTFFDKEQLADSIFISVETTTKSNSRRKGSKQTRHFIGTRLQRAAGLCLPDWATTLPLFRDAGGSYLRQWRNGKRQPEKPLKSSGTHFGQADVGVVPMPRLMRIRKYRQKDTSHSKHSKQTGMQHQQAQKQNGGTINGGQVDVARPTSVTGATWFASCTPELLPDNQAIGCSATGSNNRLP